MCRYVEAYVRYIRPTQASRNSGQALFLNAKSNRADIGRHLKDFIFYASNGSLHVTCTVRGSHYCFDELIIISKTIRKCVTTDAANARVKGRLTAEQEEAIGLNQQHSTGNQSLCLDMHSYKHRSCAGILRQEGSDECCLSRR
jgi:hypothetical protein